MKDTVIVQGHHLFPSIPSEATLTGVVGQYMILHWRRFHLMQASWLAEGLMSFTQFYTMLILAEGSQTGAGLARTLNVTPAAITKQIDQLEGLGFARRSLDLSDQRKLNIEMTDLGSDVLKNVFKNVVNLFEEFFSNQDAKTLSRFETLFSVIPYPKNVTELPGTLSEIAFNASMTLATRFMPRYMHMGMNNVTQAAICSLCYLEPMYQARIAKIIGTPAVSVSKQMVTLEKNGMIEIVSDPNDMRRTVARLSGTGYNIMAAECRSLTNFFVHIFLQLDDFGQGLETMALYQNLVWEMTEDAVFQEHYSNMASV